MVCTLNLSNELLTPIFGQRNSNSRDLDLKSQQTARINSGSTSDALALPYSIDAHERDTGLDRNVYGLLGLPIDAVDFGNLIEAMDEAAATRRPFLISTPNVNFLIKSHGNADFRNSILASDVCLVDGMPLLWIARFLQIPIKERVAGSDLFGRLKARTEKRLRVFLFGGTGDLAERVGQKLNAERCGLQCVGSLNPGFGSVTELSSAEIIGQINASGADLLAVFLNAEKAQAWLLQNHDRLTVPIRAQFGATINFEAGTVRRAPRALRSTGFEWLWRIKEEPYLWRRYWSDGLSLIRIVIGSVLPMAILARFKRDSSEFSIRSTDTDNDNLSFILAGAAIGRSVDTIMPIIQKAIIERQSLTFDLSGVTSLDGRFFGLLLTASDQLTKRALEFELVGISSRLRWIFKLNKFAFLLRK